jgi:Protein of unknown function (DUF3300)
MNRLKQVLSIFLASSIALFTLPGVMAYAQDGPTSPPPVVSAKPSKQELQQLVAPIALYPDSLVAQILAASTYPDQVVQADRWLQAHPELKGDQLAQAVNQQPWDPSVKAMAEFPSVLANMDKNLSWTSSLGDAYINNQDAVMNAIQEMRHEAQKAGNLKNTSQLTVQDQGPDIVIEPANPEVVYVPEYDPWLVYGVGIAPWPGWYWYPGLYWTGPGIGFGFGFGIGFFGGYGWGWHHWGPDWHHHYVAFDHGAWYSHSRAVANHGYYADRGHGGDGFHGGGFHGGDGFHGGGGFHGGEGFHGGDGFHGGGGFHGGAPAHSFSDGGHSGAFGGFDHGGVAGGYSARGSASMGGVHGGFGGGGGFHGGGGFGGGGFHGGGGGGHR